MLPIWEEQEVLCDGLTARLTTPFVRHSSTHHHRLFPQISLRGTTTTLRTNPPGSGIGSNQMSSTNPF